MDFIDKYVLSEEKSQQRLNICNSCESFIKSTNMCGECMCYLPWKVKMAPSSCPKEKWLHEPISQ